MYKKTKAAGVLFSLLYAAELIFWWGLFLVSMEDFFGEEGQKLDWEIILIVIIFAFAVLSLLLFLWSHKILKKVENFESAEDYKKSLSGIIAFIAVQGFVAFALSILVVGFSIETATTELLILPAVILFVIITGSGLIILDIVQNKRDLAKIK
jgi:hypothetical protein